MVILSKRSRRTAGVCGGVEMSRSCPRAAAMSVTRELTRRLAIGLGLLAALVFSSGPAMAEPVTPVPARLEGRSLDGQPVSLSALRGKVVVVVFWSTACAVCRDTLPELRANHAGWRGQPFALLTVATDAARADVSKYHELLERVRPQADRIPALWRSEPGHQDSFGALPQLPAAFVIDREGRLVERYAGRIPPQAWDRVAELLP